MLPVVRREKGARAGSGRDRLASRAARFAVWRALDVVVKDAFLGSDVVMMMNDHAYPYLDIARSLRRNGIPFVLAQEGVRFAMPQEDDTQFYGRGGAKLIAVWGESSAEHFASRGVPRSELRITGCPRFDELDLAEEQRSAKELEARMGLSGKTVLGYFSNLVDMQGYCSTKDRIGLFGRFLDAIRPLAEGSWGPTGTPRGGSSGLRVALRIHPAEDPDDFARVVGSRPWSRELVVDANDLPLFPLLVVCRAVVVLSSTIGLEASLVDRPVGVVEMPGFGYAHDYVRSGVGLPLPFRPELLSQVERLLGSFGDESRGARAEYVQKSLSRDRLAAPRITDVLEEASRGREQSLRARTVRALAHWLTEK